MDSNFFCRFAAVVAFTFLLILSEFADNKILSVSERSLRWCASIQSLDPSWSIEACVYKINVILHVSSQNDCWQGEAKISLDKSTDDLVRSSLGPHEFYFLVEGAETFWVPQRHEHDCHYTFTFLSRYPLAGASFVSHASSHRLRRRSRGRHHFSTLKCCLFVKRSSFRPVTFRVLGTAA